MQTWLHLPLPMFHFKESRRIWGLKTAIVVAFVKGYRSKIPSSPDYSHLVVLKREQHL